MYAPHVPAMLLGLVGSALAVTPAENNLFIQRRASLKAALHSSAIHLEFRQRCGPYNADVKTDVIAFPAGRADRLYILDGYQGRAYQVQNGRARLVWCGAYPQPGQKASTLRGNAARALGIPLRSAAGVLPVEKGSMDIFTGFSGAVTSSRMNAAGQVICAKRRFDERAFRSGFQFDSRDTCP